MDDKYIVSLAARALNGRDGFVRALDSKGIEHQAFLKMQEAQMNLIAALVKEVNLLRSDVDALKSKIKVLEAP